MCVTFMGNCSDMATEALNGLRLVLMSWLRARRGGAPGGAEMYSSHGTPAHNFSLASPFFSEDAGNENLGLLRNSLHLILNNYIPTGRGVLFGQDILSKKEHISI